jgi:hypothetical protein
MLLSVPAIWALNRRQGVCLIQRYCTIPRQVPLILGSRQGLPSALLPIAARMELINSRPNISFANTREA